MIYLFLLLFMISIGCTTKSKEISDKALTEENKHFNSKIGTAGLPIEINAIEEEKLAKLKTENRVEYARKTLKMYAYCNCLYRSLSDDTAFISKDNSNGFVLRELVLHPQNILDSIRAVVNKYITPKKERQNVSLLCLSLYESSYLDSIIKRFDSTIKTKNF